MYFPNAVQPMLTAPATAGSECLLLVVLTLHSELLPAAQIEMAIAKDAWQFAL